MEELLKQVSELAAKNLHRNILSCFRQKAAPKKPAMLTGAPPIPPLFSRMLESEASLFASV